MSSTRTGTPRSYVDATGYREDHHAIELAEQNAMSAYVEELVRRLATATANLLGERPSAGPIHCSHILSPRDDLLLNDIDKLHAELKAALTHSSVIDGVPQYANHRMRAMVAEAIIEMDRNDGDRLMTILNNMGDDTEVVLTSLELDRLTKGLDGQCCALPMTPREFFARTVLLPQTSDASTTRSRETTYDALPVDSYVDTEVSLKRSDPLNNMARYNVLITYKHSSSVHDIRFRIPEDQLELWAAMFDENLAEMIQSPLSQFEVDPLREPVKGTMKIPVIAPSSIERDCRFRISMTIDNGPRTFTTSVFRSFESEPLAHTPESIAELESIDPEHFTDRLPTNLAQPSEI